MPVSVNASPAKVYVMLFIFVIVGYGAFIISRTLKRSGKELEHFVEDNPNYKFRLEVMKVFDLYMNRNPTPEEIEKYARIQNEQDILLTILKDFNITASDVNKEKLAKYEKPTVTVEEEYVDIAPSDMPLNVLPLPSAAPRAVSVTSESIDVDKLLAEMRAEAKQSTTTDVIDTWKEKSQDDSDRITVPRALFNDLHTKVTELTEVVNGLKAAAS